MSPYAMFRRLRARKPHGDRHGSASARSRPLRIETLERRDCPASSVTAILVDGVLAVEGTPAANAITIVERGDSIRVARRSFSAAEVSGIAVSGLAGSDTLRNNTSKPATLEGGIGNDTLYGGPASDKLTGGPGRDFLAGQDGADVLFGGEGNDLYFGGADNDMMDDGSGFDRMYGEAGDDAMFGYSPEGAYVDGGDGNDHLYGGSIGNVTLLGGSGNDGLYAGGGANSLVGGTGNDELRAAGGIDTLFGGTGNDSLYGGAGNDWMSGDADNDWLYGEEGNDDLSGSTGDDWICGGADNDWIYGHAGRDVLFGEAGIDNVYGGTGPDTAYGGDGDDWLNGSHDNDFLLGEGGHDNLWGGDGDDFLTGGDGDDWMYGEGGTDKLFGDAGNDNLRGGDGNDKLYGNAGADGLYGEAGSDWMDAGASWEHADGGPDMDFNAYVTVVNGAYYTDIIQGGGGTCWILASIGTALHSGISLSHRITYVGNDVYRVDLFNRRVFADPAQGYVARTEYVRFNGDLVGADPGAKVDGESWVIILQRAVLQAVMRWDSTQSLENPHGGGASDAFGILLGTQSAWRAPSGYASAEEMLNLTTRSGKRVVAHTTGTATTLVAGHAYTVVGGWADQVMMWNPWGAFVTVSWDVFKKDVGSICIN